MTLFRRAPAEVKALLTDGERALAWSATAPDGWVVASGERLVCTAPTMAERWVTVLGASWAEPVLEVSLWRPSGVVVQRIRLVDGDVVPQVVRERIMQSLVVQQYVKIRGNAGVRFLARRDPTTDEVTWQRVLDPGLDGADPAVRAEIDQALAVLRDTYGV